MIDLTKYGYIQPATPPSGLIPGRITEVQRELYTVITCFGEASATLKGSFYYTAEARTDFPCVGDFVLVEQHADAFRIAELLPRFSKFSRSDFSGHSVGYVKTVLEQVVAANFDYVFIVTSLNNDFNAGRILRYVTQARGSGGKPIVILTKADLVTDAESHIASVREIAQNIPVCPISSLTGQGVKQLDEFLQPGKTVVLLGMSGAGKSSLVNALMNEEVMTVRSIREDDSRGRHTTTHRQLFMLPSGAMVIDTPGMRELGLFGAQDAISEGFSDVEELFEECRFSDCSHKKEPGCAVIAAIKDGRLTRKRWEQYLAQRRENHFADDKASFLREKRVTERDGAMWHRERRKNGGNRKR